MSKAIRFAELVKRSGKPETVTLWTKPKDNPQLMKAVRENRVLTLIQKSTGTTADFGEIGFYQQPSALYLVFPKALPSKNDSRVIGIKYELMRETIAPEPNNKETPKKKISQPPKPAVPTPPKPVSLKTFSVTLLRNATQEIKLTVKAQNLQAAEIQAMEVMKTREFAADEIQNEIKTITQK
jgi:hypothetical protein